jgi:hypothetical protein
MVHYRGKMNRQHSTPESLSLPSSSTPYLGHFQSCDTAVGAGVAIFHLATQRVVLCRHSRDRYWFLPKGRKDANEDTTRGAEREGYEEVICSSLSFHWPCLGKPGCSLGTITVCCQFHSNTASLSPTSSLVPLPAETLIISSVSPYGPSYFLTAASHNTFSSGTSQRRSLQLLKAGWANAQCRIRPIRHPQDSQSTWR